MKKFIVVTILLALAAGGAFAQLSMSAGGGALFDFSTNNGAKDGGDLEGFRILSFGGYVFFDATYVEADVYFAYGKNTAYQKVGGSSDSEDSGSSTQLGFSLLGKYPIELGSITIFPLLGVNYNMVLVYKYPGGDEFKDSIEKLSQFGILGGIGMDYFITDSLYLRAEGLFHLRFPTKRWNDSAVDGAKATLGMGPVVKVGLGYKF